MPLVELGWEEDLCGLWCKYSGLLSPTYDTGTRDGCWFCHNQGPNQLRLLRKNYPHLWELLLKWDKDSPIPFNSNGRSVHDYDARFEMEDLGFIDPTKRFLWQIVTEYQNSKGETNET